MSNQGTGRQFCQQLATTPSRSYATAGKEILLRGSKRARQRSSVRMRIGGAISCKQEEDYELRETGSGRTRKALRVIAHIPLKQPYGEL